MADPVLIQSKSLAYTSNGGENKQLTLDAPTTIGNTIIIVGFTTSGGNYLTASDQGGNTYGTAGAYDTRYTGAQASWIFSGYQASASTTVGLTNQNTGNDLFGFIAMEFSNIKQTGAFDQRDQALVGGGDADGGTVTIGERELVIVAIRPLSTDDYTPNGAWTEVGPLNVGGGPTSCSLQYKLLDANTYASVGPWTSGGTGSVNGLTATYKIESAAPATSLPPPSQSRMPSALLAQ